MWRAWSRLGRAWAGWQTATLLLRFSPRHRRLQRIPCTPAGRPRFQARPRGDRRAALVAAHVTAALDGHGDGGIARIVDVAAGIDRCNRPAGRQGTKVERAAGRDRCDDITLRCEAVPDRDRPARAHRDGRLLRALDSNKQRIIVRALRIAGVDQQLAVAIRPYCRELRAAPHDRDALHWSGDDGQVATATEFDGLEGWHWHNLRLGKRGDGNRER